MVVHIKNLRLRTVIGANDWERDRRQDVIINVEFEFDGTSAAQTDDLKDTVDYKAMKRRIIDAVEHSEFFLLEKLAARILELVMQDDRVERALIEVDKPNALRFADSVSVSCSAERKP